MKDRKYIVTDKHPELKEGVIFEQSLSRPDMYVSAKPNDTTYIPDFDTVMLLEKGFICEVQEPEFTRDDMIAFAVDYVHGNTMEAEEDQLEIYIKNK